jgi:uncharacterized alpha-E superfamily protein
VISRVADYCFWFGRYVERAESMTRLLQATRALVFDAGLPVTQCWQPLVIVTGEYPSFCERFGEEAAVDGERVQEELTWNPEIGASLTASVRAARECGRVIRDVLSIDTWEAINELYHFLGRDSTRLELYNEDREELYRSVRRSTQLTLGLVRSTMLHDEPMSFLWLGAMIERAGQVARLLDVHHHTIQLETERQDAHDIVKVALWLSLLRACSGAEAFMKRHQGRVSAQAVVAFLLFEGSFPRSLRYCLNSSQGLLRRIWPTERPSTARLDQLLRHLEAHEEGIAVTDIHALLTHIVDESTAICTLVSTDILGPQPTVAAPAPSVAATEPPTAPVVTANVES